MIQPLVTFATEAAPSGTPKVGDIVSNFGNLARVAGIHDSTGDFILEAHGLQMFSGRWCAPATNCTLVEAR